MIITTYRPYGFVTAEFVAYIIIIVLRNIVLNAPDSRLPVSRLLASTYHTLVCTLKFLILGSISQTSRRSSSGSASCLFAFRILRSLFSPELRTTVEKIWLRKLPLPPPFHGYIADR